MPAVPPELSRIDIGDAEMQYLAYGASGPAVVLLHATGFLPWLWHPIAESLAEDHRVIAPCFYNHRPSDPFAGGLGWLRLADDLHRMCGRLGLEKPCFVGHSMGATVGMLAHAVQGAPSAGIILIEPIFLPPDAYRRSLSPDQHPLAAKAIKRRNHWPNRKAVWEDFKAKPFFGSWDEAELALYIEYGICEADSGGVTLVCTPWQEAALFMGGVQHDPWPDLPKVTCPALIVEGEMSENRILIDLKRAAALIPRASYAKVLDAGHLIPMEKPIETARLVRSYVDSLMS
jgi:lipase